MCRCFPRECGCSCSAIALRPCRAVAIVREASTRLPRPSRGNAGRQRGRRLLRWLLLQHVRGGGGDEPRQDARGRRNHLAQRMVVQVARVSACEPVFAGACCLLMPALALQGSITGNWFSDRQTTRRHRRACQRGRDDSQSWRSYPHDGGCWIRSPARERPDRVGFWDLPGIARASTHVYDVCACVRVCMQAMMVCGSCAAGGGVLECRGGHRARRADRDPSQSQVP